MNTTTTGGIEIAWEASGNHAGPPIVFLHSLGSDHGMWKPQVAALEATHRVIAIDTRGHGRSHAPTTEYELGSLCGDVLAVADAANIDRFHVCGVSLGGQMALWLGANRPDRVLSVTAANTGAKIGDDSSWGARIDAIRSNGMASLRDAVIERWFSPDFAERHPDWLAAAGATFDRTAQAGYIGCCHALAGADLRESVLTIDCPTLVVGSTLDVSTPPEQAEWLAERIDGATLTIIEDAAHLSNLDRSDAFTSALLDFLPPA